MFKLASSYQPKGDQPKAIEKLVKNLMDKEQHQVLLGVTGSGKTFTMAKVIEKTNKPALIISHNKTLAAQLYQEFKEYFPNNAVHYFVSYYDYYQPEAYIPQSDTYIEKDARINEQIDRLRHAATQDLLSRRDVIVIASVSCIYNIGNPESYNHVSLEFKTGQEIKRKTLLLSLISLQYERNDIDFKPGTFRIRGDFIDIHLVTGEEILRIEIPGDIIEKLFLLSPSLGAEAKRTTPAFKLFPAKFWATPQENIEIALKNIYLEMEEQVKKLKKQNKLIEAQRLERRTKYDIEILRETGSCHGVENYSRQLEFRKPGQAPYSLLDYFKKDFLIFIDESHITIPQIKAMAVQDRVRKNTLIEYGFRLPSALDNRPLTFEEFQKRIPQTIYVSATPSEFEKEKAGKKNIVEQIIRPTGLIEPSIEIRPTANQVKDLIAEVKKRVAEKQRILVVTLTKRLAEALAEYLNEEGVKTQWLHAEVKTMKRPQILKDLREGKFSVLVGINLLREGLDLPEVGLVAILDADKEGFLRTDTTLIQTMGRAARHPKGHVIMYADKITESMKKAVKEISRRREVQKEYNKKNNITPKAVVKAIRDWPFASAKEIATTEFGLVNDINLLEKEMKKAAEELDFERAAELRDLIKKTKGDKDKTYANNSIGKKSASKKLKKS
jgi:excinuclease ABC subunit B